MNGHKQVTLPDELMEKAEERARTLGLSVTEYVQSLVIDDVEQLDDLAATFSWEVEKQYLLDEIEFYEAEKNLPQTAASTVEELMNLLDKEIQQPDPIVEKQK